MSNNFSFQSWSFNYKKDVENFCYEIEKCTQRGTRLLTVVDLIKAETITEKQACFFLEKIKNESSFIVGAKPGGAGKTTLMQALLCFLPPEIGIIHTESEEVLEKGKNYKKSCFLCHEIGPGHYYTYLWGKSLLKFFQLKNYGHIIVSNLHADTIEEAKHQICVQNPVPEELFNSVELYIFLKVERENWHYKRKVWKIWEAKNNKLMEFKEENYRPKREYSDFIRKTVEKNIFSMLNLRKFFLEFFN